VAVVPDGGGQGEDALADAGLDSCWGSGSVAFEVELAFEGVVDGLDELSDRFEQVFVGVWGLLLRWLGLIRVGPSCAGWASRRRET
jgi:hypothetical protein